MPKAEPLAIRGTASSNEDTDAWPYFPLLRSKRGGWRMLLIEDQVSDIFLAEEMLDESMPDYDWRVLDRPSLSSAITLLQETPFDLALVDLTLQDADGPDVVATLRAAAPTLPIVVYSGSADPALQKQAIEAGASFCIEKGKISPRLVRAILQSALEPNL